MIYFVTLAVLSIVKIFKPDLVVFKKKVDVEKNREIDENNEDDIIDDAAKKAQEMVLNGRKPSSRAKK